VDDPAGVAALDWGAVGELPAGVFVPVQAGQGCHCRCRFCDFACLQQARARSIESLIAEIRSIPPRGGLRRVYFTDDNLFATRARARVMFDAIRRSGMRLRWRGLVRIDLVDDEIADLMAESGCLEVLLGIESGDAGMLRAMRKGGTPEGILRGVERLAARGINTKSTFIVGYPGETDRSIAHTVDLLNAFPVGGRAVHRYTLFTFAVLPLSDVAGREERARWGLEGYGFRWRHRTMTSEESAAHMLAMHDRIREELSPSYVGDVPEWRGVDRAALRRVFLARNRLARLRRGLPVGGRLDEAGLWNQIERAFCTVLHS
jgi:p-methyltransferase